MVNTRRNRRANTMRRNRRNRRANTMRRNRRMYYGGVLPNSTTATMATNASTTGPHVSSTPALNNAMRLGYTVNNNNPEIPTSLPRRSSNNNNNGEIPTRLNFAINTPGAPLPNGMLPARRRINTPGAPVPRN